MPRLSYTEKLQSLVFWTFQETGLLFGQMALLAEVGSLAGFIFLVVLFQEIVCHRYGLISECKRLFVLGVHNRDGDGIVFVLLTTYQSYAANAQRISDGRHCGIAIRRR